MTRYHRRISGPLLDRIDVHVEVPRVKYEEMASVATGDRSESIGKRVGEAREIGAKRLSGTGRLMNAEMNPKDVDRFCKTDRDAESLLRHAHDRLQLSGRGFHRVLKVARTIADLDGASGSAYRIWARLCNIARGLKTDKSTRRSGLDLAGGLSSCVRQDLGYGTPLGLGLHRRR